MLGMTKGMLGMTPLFLLNEAHFSFCHSERSEASISDFFARAGKVNPCAIRLIHVFRVLSLCGFLATARNDTKKVLGMLRSYKFAIHVPLEHVPRPLPLPS